MALCGKRRQEPVRGGTRRQRRHGLGSLLVRGWCPVAALTRPAGDSRTARASQVAVITPRTTRLVRVPDLHTFRQAIVELACDGAPLEARDRLIVVPTRAA